MTDVARVRLRNIQLADSAAILGPEGGPAGATSFVALEAPPPVGTVLTLGGAGDATREVRVLRVVEAGGEHGVAGVYVAPADEQALARAGQVGTEGLAPMERAQAQDAAARAPSDEVDEELATSAEAGADAAGPAPQAGGFAVPAPVVEPEPSEAIDLGHPAQEQAPRSGKRRKGRRRG